MYSFLARSCFFLVEFLQCGNGLAEVVPKTFWCKDFDICSQAEDSVLQSYTHRQFYLYCDGVRLAVCVASEYFGIAETKAGLVREAAKKGGYPFKVTTEVKG